MDIQKEREAFEQALVNQKNVSINNLHVCTIFDAEKNKYSPSDVCDPKEDFIVDWINSSWSIWQAAKAQAVPEWISVEDRLPKKGEMVYGYAAKHNYTCPVVFNGKKFYNEGLADNSISHWHYLAKPMKAQEPTND